MAAPQASSRLEILQARFQQKQLQEKEQKLLQLYDQQQQRAYQVVQRGSAGSNQGATARGTTTTMTTTTAAMTTTMTTTTTTHTTSTSQGGKVRQMFDERRQTTVKGIDRSYPLEPLENKLRKQTTGTNGLAAQRNGNAMMNRQSVIVKRAARADVNSNVNGGKPVVSYHEEVTRESFGPSVHRHGDEDEFGVENRITTFANGYHRHDVDNQREDALEQEAIERNRMMAKIHLMGYDESLKHRVRNDLESEEFPEYLMVDVPDKLPKRSVTKKLSQAEARLERFKNANAKRSNMPKHYSTTSNASVAKKRSEQMLPARPNSRGSEIAGTSPTGARNGSSWSSERSQRNPENVRNPRPADKARAVDRAYVIEEMSKGRKASSDIETFSRRGNPQSPSRNIKKAEIVSRINHRSSDFKSLTPDGKIFVRHSMNPQLFRREFIHSGTTTSIDRKSAGSRSASADRYTRIKRSTSPEFFCREDERSATTMKIDRRRTEPKSTSLDRKTYLKRSSSPEFFRREDERSSTTMSIDRKSIGSKSASSDRLMKRSTSPEFYCREGERSATTMKIDRRRIEPKSTSLDRQTYLKRSTSTRYSDTEFNRSATGINRKDSKTKSLEWDGKASSRESASPQSFYRESERSGEAIDRSATVFESSDTREKLFTKPRVTSQHLRNLFERSDASASVDRKSSSPRSPLFYRGTLIKRGTSPAFFLSESGQSRRTSESASPIWSREISPRRSASPRYSSSEFKQSETTSTGQMSIGSKLSGWRKENLAERNTIPRYFDKKSRRTSASLDRETPSKSPSYEREILEKRSASLDRKVSEPALSLYDKNTLIKRSRNLRSSSRESERSATSRSIDRKYVGSKSSETTRDRRTSSPQFFCRESERSATTMLIEPRPGSTDSTKNMSKQRNYASYVPPKRPVRSSLSINRNVRSTHASRHTPSPSVTKRETKKDSKEEERIKSTATETRRSSRISETSATSASSIVSLKYGLEFDNIFQSTGLVRKFMKSHDGKQPSNKIRLSSSRRGIKKTVSVQATRNNQSKSRYRTCSLLQKSRSPSIDSGRRTTPESPRKSITPTEVDVEIQEITMTDHRIERDKLRKASSPAAARDRVERTYTKSPHDRTKFKTSFAHPAGKVYRRKTFNLQSDVLASRPDSFCWKNKKSEDRQSDRDDRGRSARAAPKYESPSPSVDNESGRSRPEDKEKDTGVDEVDVGIDTKYRTIVEGTLNRQIESYRETARPSSALDRIERKSDSLRGSTRTPTRPGAARRTISPTKDCGRRHDVDSGSPPRFSSLGRASRGVDVPKIPSRRAAPRTPARNSKFLTYTVHKERECDSVAFAGRKGSTESPGGKTSAGRTIERSVDDVAREFSRVSTRRGRGSEKDLARMERSGPHLRTSPEISLRTMDVRTRTSAEDLIASGGSTVDATREVTTWKSTARTRAGGACLKLRNGARKSDWRVPREEICPSERTTKGGNSAENRRRSAQRRLPTCRRQLFESDAGKGIQAARAKSSYAKTRKKENYSASVDLTSRKDGTASNVRSTRATLAKRSERSAGTSATTISVKPLRSIEDIRRSIDNKRGKLTGTTRESRSAIASRRTAFKSRKLAGADGERSDVARNALLPAGEPASSTKVKSCVSRITKSPSPDTPARRQHETNARAARGSAPASPSKSPDIAPRRASTEVKNQDAKPSRRPTAAKGAESMEVSKATGTVDATDGVALRNGSLRESSTSKSDAFVVDFDDRPSKESDTTPTRKATSVRSTSEKHQTVSSVSGRPISVSSNSSPSATQGQAVNTKSKMAAKVKTPNSGGPQAKGSFLNKNAGNATVTDNLIDCKMCGRRFAQDRISLHEEICAKTMNKKRKQFNTAIFRVRGTELEPFAKKSVAKKQESNEKKPQLKSDWRRKHEDFIATIRYAKQAQMHIAAGGKLSDLPQPPASDTSDYIQCPHCGRKFNQAAAERHIPKCERMLHNKPANARAPRPRR